MRLKKITSPNSLFKEIKTKIDACARGIVQGLRFHNTDRALFGKLWRLRSLADLFRFVMFVHSFAFTCCAQTVVGVCVCQRRAERGLSRRSSTKMMWKVCPRLLRRLRLQPLPGRRGISSVCELCLQLQAFLYILFLFSFFSFFRALFALSSFLLCRSISSRMCVVEQYLWQ